MRGEYLLVETRASAGYEILDKPVAISLTRKATTVLTTSDKYSTMAVITKDSDGKDVVNVKNSTGYELPATGGSGTRFIYLMAMLLMVASVIGMYIKKNRRNAFYIDIDKEETKNKKQF